MVVIGSGFTLARIAPLGQTWLYSGKKVVVLGNSGCIRQKQLYSRNVVVFGQNGCMRAKVVLS